MTLVVQKFGGTSVGDADRIRAVADHVARTRRSGKDVVVVVSAMGKTTDGLIRLAEDVSRVGLLVLVDASKEPGTTGSVSTRGLEADPVSDAVFSHHVDPARLLKLSSTLFGQSPRAVQVSIKVTDLEVGTDLSGPIRDAMPDLVDAVIGAIEQHRLQNA